MFHWNHCISGYSELLDTAISISLLRPTEFANRVESTYSISQYLCPACTELNNIRKAIAVLLRKRNQDNNLFERNGRNLIPF